MSDPESTNSWINPSQSVADIGAALAMLALGIGFLVGVARLDFGASDAPGPAMFPALLAVGLILTSIAMLLQRLLRGSSSGASVPLGHWYSITAAITLLAVTVPFAKIGFPAAAFVMLFLLTKVFTGTRIVSALLFAAVTTAVAYLLFTRAFGVALPLGAVFTR